MFIIIRYLRKLLKKIMPANTSVNNECQLPNFGKNSVADTDSDFDASSKSKSALILSEMHVSVSKQFLKH